MLPAQGNIFNSWQNPYQGQQRHPVAPFEGNQGSFPPPTPVMLYNPASGTRVTYCPSMPPPPVLFPFGTPTVPSSAPPHQMMAHGPHHQFPTPQTSPIPQGSPTSFWSSSTPLQGPQMGFISSPGEQQMYQQFLLCQQHQERLRLAHQMAASGFQGQQVQSFPPQLPGQYPSQMQGYPQPILQGVAPPPQSQPLQEAPILRGLIESDDRAPPAHQVHLQAQQEPPQAQAAPQEAHGVQAEAAPPPLPPGVRPYKGPWFQEEPEKKKKEPIADVKPLIKVKMEHPAPPVSPASLPEASSPQVESDKPDATQPVESEKRVEQPPAESQAPKDPRISCSPSSIYYKPPRQTEVSPAQQQQESQLVSQGVRPGAPRELGELLAVVLSETMIEPLPKQPKSQKRPENLQGQAKKALSKSRPKMPVVPPLPIKRKIKIVETRTDGGQLQGQEKLQKQKTKEGSPQPLENQQRRPVEDQRQERAQQGVQAHEEDRQHKGPQSPQQHRSLQDDLEIQEVRPDGLQDPRKVPCPKGKRKTPAEMAAVKKEMMDYEDAERRQKGNRKKEKNRIEEENEDRENREHPSMFDLFGPDLHPTSPRARKRRSTESTDSEGSKKGRRSIDGEELSCDLLRISTTPPSTPSTLNAPMNQMSISSAPAKDLPPWRSTTSEPYVPPQLTTLPVQLVHGEGDDTETIPAIGEDRDRDFDQDEDETKSNIFDRFQSCLNAVSNAGNKKVPMNVSNTPLEANKDVENSSTSSRSSEAKKISATAAEVSSKVAQQSSRDAQRSKSNDVVNQSNQQNIFSMKQETTNKKNEDVFAPSHTCTGYDCEVCEMMDLEETLRIAHLPRFNTNRQ